MAGLRSDEAGLTLIELMFVMLTIGVLAGLGLQSWQLYKTRAYNTTAQTDLKNSLISLETYIDDNEEYPECEGQDCTDSMSGFTHTPGVYIGFVSTGGLSGTVTACYPNKGNVAYIRPSVADVTIEVPIGACGS